MKCFIDYIGLMGCGNPAPESGLFVNSLPGISLEQVSKLADADQRNYVKTWSDVQLLASADFESAITLAFRERYRIRSIRSSVNIGMSVVKDTPITVSGSPYLVGYEINPEAHSIAPYGKSNLQNIYLQQVPFYFGGPAEEDGTELTLHIIDTASGVELESKTIVATAVGWVYFTINGMYTADKIFVGIDPSAGVYSLSLTDKVNSAFSSALTSFYGCDCHGVIQGAIMPSADDLTELTYSTNSYGLSGTFSLVCSYQNIVCANKDVFKYAWLYTLGKHIQEARLSSPRWNKWTRDPEEAIDMISRFSKKRDKEIEAVVDGIDLDTNDVCLNCDTQISIQSQMP